MASQTRIIAKFKRFLKQNHAYPSFVKYCASNHENGTKKPDAHVVENYLLNKLPIYYISQSFIWTKTAQGYIFWLSLDSRWKSLIENRFNNF